MRKFLTRIDATYSLGVMEARTLAKHPVIGVRVACRIGGVVYEATKSEALHAQVTLRAYEAGATGTVEDGFTAEEATT